MKQIDGRKQIAFWLLAVWCLYQLAFSEIIAVAGGFGFDGQFYGNLALAIARGGAHLDIDPYRMQRVAPSLLVGNLLHVVGAHEVADVVAAFKLLTALELLAAMAIWIRITKTLHINGWPFWIGTALTFGSFGVARNSFYYPVSTDTTALLLGFALCLAYVRSSMPRLFALGLAGSFIWPVCGPVAALALAFPRRQGGARLHHDRIGAVGGGVAAIAIVLAGACVLFVLGRTRMGLGPVAEIDAGRIWWSVAIHGAFLLAALTILGRHIPVSRPGAIWNALDPRGIALAVMVLAVPRLVTAQVASAGPPLLSIKTFAAMIAFLPLVRPGTVLVSHFAFFGLLVPFAIFFWPGIARSAAKGGIGSLIVLLFTLIIFLTPETRQSMMTLPIVAVLLCVAMQERRWPSLVGLALIAGQFALLLLARSQNDGASPDAPGIKQLPGYFARQGPYMDWAAYQEHLVWFGAAVVGVLVALQLATMPPRQAPKPTPAADDGGIT